VYLTGSTSMPVGGEDIWVARYDSAGHQLWLRQFGSAADDDAIVAMPDGHGGVVIGGDTEGNLGGPTAGQRDAWAAWYDSAGNRLWLTQWGTDADDWLYSAAPDGDCGIVLLGTTTGSLGGPNAGGMDVWLALRTPFSACYANCDASCVPPLLNVLDFTCFLNKFAAGDPYANCDHSTTPPVLNVLDFTCFLNQFAAGCN
jgi:hypothetical protein